MKTTLNYKNYLIEIFHKPIYSLKWYAQGLRLKITNQETGTHRYKRFFDWSLDQKIITEENISIFAQEIQSRVIKEIDSKIKSVNFLP